MLRDRQGGDRRGGGREQKRHETIGMLGTPLAFRLLRSEMLYLSGIHLIT